MNVFFLQFVLILPESDRVARRALRETAEAENAEERLLRENPSIGKRINCYYCLYGCTPVEITAGESVEALVERLVEIISKTQQQCQ